MISKNTIIVAAAFLTTACAANIGDQLGDPSPSTMAAGKIIAIDTPAQRIVRAGGFAVIACELAADSALRGNAEEAPGALVLCQRLQRAIAGIRDSAGLWTNADLFDAKRLVVIAAGEQAKKKATSLLARLTFRDALGSLAKGVKAVAMLRDVSYIIEAVQADKLTLAGAWTGIEGRMTRNMDRLLPLVDGAPP